MKKILLLSACAALVLGMASCSQKSQKTDNETSEISTADTTAAAPAAPLTSADLHLFGLHGNVKHVTCNAGGLSAWPISATNLDYDEQGNLVNADLKVAKIRNGKNTQGKFKRDDQGRISEFDNAKAADQFERLSWTIHYDQYGGIQKLESAGWEYGADSKYTCDENGFILSSSVYQYSESFQSNYKRTYEYPEKDAQGNWTKLIITEKRTDSEFNFDTNDNQVTGTEKRTITVTRNITYY